MPGEILFRDSDMISGRCAACKYLRRRCPPDCIFAPYFPSDNLQRFATVHRIYGASNVGKMLQGFLSISREYRKSPEQKQRMQCILKHTAEYKNRFMGVLESSITCMNKLEEHKWNWPEFKLSLLPSILVYMFGALPSTEFRVYFEKNSF